MVEWRSASADTKKKKAQVAYEQLRSACYPQQEQYFVLIIFTPIISVALSFFWYYNFSEIINKAPSISR